MLRNEAPATDETLARCKQGCFVPQDDSRLKKIAANSGTVSRHEMLMFIFKKSTSA